MVAFARDHSAKDLRGFLDVLVQNYRPTTTTMMLEAARTKRPCPAVGQPGRLVAPDRVPGPGHRRRAGRGPGRLRGQTSPDDHRTAGNRTADALAEIAHGPGPDRPAVRAGSHHADPDPRPADHRAGVRWPSGLLASRTDVHTTACSGHHRGGIPTDPIHWQPQPSGSRNGTPPKPNAPPSPYATGPAAYPGCTVPAHRCIAHHIRPWDDRGPTDLTNLVLICHFSPPHSPPRQTRHHPNPHRPLHRHPHQPGTTHRRPVTGPDRPDPTDPKNCMKPPVTGCAPPTQARTPVTEACPPARCAHSTARSGVRASGPERGLRRTVAAGSTTESAGAVT